MESSDNKLQLCWAGLDKGTSGEITCWHGRNKAKFEVHAFDFWVIRSVRSTWFWTLVTSFDENFAVSSEHIKRAALKAWNTRHDAFKTWQVFVCQLDMNRNKYQNLSIAWLKWPTCGDEDFIVTVYSSFRLVMSSKFIFDLKSQCAKTLNS